MKRREIFGALAVLPLVTFEKFLVKGKKAEDEGVEVMGRFKFHKVPGAADIMVRGNSFEMSPGQSVELPMPEDGSLTIMENIFAFKP